MDFSPLVLAAVVAVIGMTEGIKHKLPKMSSTLVSIVATLITAISISDFSGFTDVGMIKFVQAFIFHVCCIMGGSWLMYESIIKRYKGEKE